MKALTLEDFEDMRKSENFVLIDVLSRENYEDGHIPGSINIPVDRIDSIAEEILSKNQNIVVYCASESCSASDKAAEKLESLGFENVMDFEAGIEGWESGGHELEA